jgi:hypothetical protein
MLTKGGQYQYTILQSAAVAVGNGTAVVPTNSDEGAFTLLTLQIVGITTATITWEASVDGTNYVAVNARNVNTQVVATTATADGLYRINATGYFSLRARISAWTSGTIYVYGLLSAMGDAGVGATDASLTTLNTTLTTTNTEIGGLTETAPATDTASSGLNGRLQRIAQRITSLIALLPAALGQGTMAQSLRVVVASDQATYPVTATVALPTVVYNGLTNVTTAGTRVVLASTQAIVSGVTIKARASNTGTIYVGSSAVSSSNGYSLAASESVFLEIANITTVNIDSSVNGEGVTYIAT